MLYCIAKKEHFIVYVPIKFTFNRKYWITLHSI